MNNSLRYLLLFAAIILTSTIVMAQVAQWRDMHKVKRKETIYSIAKKYEITVEELISANPEMREPDFKLKKGAYVRIPYAGQFTQNGNVSGSHGIDGAKRQDAMEQAESKKPVITRSDVRSREVRIGVMLPFDSISNDGKHMTEYYRGLLMACDSLRQENISTSIRAWNVNQKTDISTILNDTTLSQLDIIIGPFYGTQMKPVADYASQYGIKQLIPYFIAKADSIAGSTTFLAFHDDAVHCSMVAEQFMSKFDTCHTVIINSDNMTGRKGLLSNELQRKLKAASRPYTVTSLDASDADFTASFNKDKRNVAVLNTGRPQDLNIAFARLNTLTITNPEMRVTLFGHTEWLAFTNQNLSEYYKYDTYIPSTFYMNPLSPRTARMNLKYRWNFHDDMENALPRFAMTGFDHAYFFIKGLKKRGADFEGRYNDIDYVPLQNPMNFKPSNNGARENRSFMLIHYTPEYDIESYTY